MTCQRAGSPVLFCMLPCYLYRQNGIIVAVDERWGTFVNYLKMLKPLDWLVLVFGMYLIFFDIDYAKLSTLDIIYIVCMALWVVMLVVRIRIEYKKGKTDGKDRKGGK